MVKSRHFSNFKKDHLSDVTGKVFGITGTTSGTGFIAARTVAEYGGEVILLNRASTRATESLKKLQAAVPNGKFVPVECDLQNFESVRKACSEIKKRYDKLYCLANNAGIMSFPDKATVDGYDLQMQTNHLSHFLLTAELLPLLEAEALSSGDARIVNHSSLGRLHTPKNALEERYFQKNGGKLGGDLVTERMNRYSQTKLANSVFTYGLHKKLQQHKNDCCKVRVVAAHPGVATTSLFNPSTGNGSALTNSVMRPLIRFLAQSEEDGAMGLIKGMMDKSAESGVLYGPKNAGYKGRAVPNPPKPCENDPAAIDMLWRTSEAATGVSLLSDDSRAKL